MTHITTDVAERVAQAHAKRQEREVLGAWMAGYDYLHHCERPSFHSFGYKEKYIPSDNEKPPRTPYRKRQSSWSIETFDLRWLFPDDVKVLKREDA